MGSEPLVRVDNVSKKFCGGLKRSLWYGVQDIAADLFALGTREDGLRPGEFWALKDISFELRRGACLGLIGENGAGKSTLLRLLNGLIRPTRGHIAVARNTGALIELNTGINPILTGRENIYVSASVLGVSRKGVDRIIDEVIGFAGIEEFIDTPVQYYSSGMKVRLGFSIAASIMQPDVLLIDEVLAVGDASFRSKCYNRIGKLSESAAVIFVSHNMNHVAHICDRCLLLKDGCMAHYGDVAQGIQLYLEDSQSTDFDESGFEAIEYPVKSVTFKWSMRDVEYAQSIDLTAHIDTYEAMHGVTVRIPFYDLQGVVVAEWDSKLRGERIDLQQGHNELRISLGPLYLKAGTYRLAFVLNDAEGIRLPIWSYKEHSVRVDGAPGGAASYQLPLSGSLEPQNRA